MDDSFAEVRARRTAAGNAKGKGRDPREGPGLGSGERGAPIEIGSGSEEEEEEDEDEEEYDEDGWDEDEDGVRTSDEEAEEEENAWRNGESSAHAHARYRKYADRREEYEGEEDVRDPNDPDFVELISDDEGSNGGHHANGILPDDGPYSGDEYSEEEDASLFVASQNATRPPQRDYSDEGSETGSESEHEAGRFFFLSNVTAN